MRVLTIFMLLTSCFYLQAQKTITGKILFENAPVPFVSLQIQHLSTGSISNINGEFKLSSPSTFDTLLVSHIGFQSMKIGIDLYSDEPILIILKENIITLDEVTITSAKLIKNPKEIVRRAIQFTSENSNQGDFVYQGHYRHTDIQDGGYKRLIDASVQIKQSSIGHNIISILEIRKTQDERILYKNGQQLTQDEMAKKEENINSYDLKCWFNKHNYQYDANNFLSSEAEEFCAKYSNGRLTKDFYKQYKFKVDTISSYHDDLVYVVKLLPSLSSPKYYLYSRSLVIPVGKLFIRTSDFAILRVEYNYILNPKKKGSIDFKIVNEIFGTKILAQYLVNFQEYEGKIYLSYISSKDYHASSEVERRIRGNNRTSVYHLLHREFSVNEVLLSDSEINTTKENTPCGSDLFICEKNHNPTFWNSFNGIPETKELEEWRKKSD